ncbi:hypothetical protein H4S04_003471 [Coemansia sp. S16]|nr:hypothetical protein H4S04_003471 [Coemansia sp. S16]KAJ2058689.1 hypothetical protein GGI08_003376 [Coemansia sp. S2]KAJ2342979.1 hypothetical protein GGH92_005136 [Coemansia sp. RSA 2673]
MASAGSAANAAAAAKFWDYFQQQKEAINALAVLSKDDASQKIRDLDSSLREAFIYLPPYDQKRLSKDLDELRGQHHQQRSTSKQQGFKFKSAVAKPNNALATASSSVTAAASEQPSSADSDGQASPPATGPSHKYTGISNSWVVADMLSLLGEVGTASPTDCELRDITNSVVDLRPISQSLRALNCHRIQNSIVICGPFAGSVTVRDSNNCVLVLGARQFRLENSQGVDVYLYCTSHPIIEKSSGIRFAPYPAELRTPRIEQEFGTSQLGLQPNSFDRVDDFNWLKRQASPNWSIPQASALPSADVWSLLDDASKPRAKLIQALVATHQERE